MKIFNAEIENFYASKIPARRPNSMNNYGDLVKNLGANIRYRYDFFNQPWHLETVDTCFYISRVFTFFGWLLGWKELENWNWHSRGVIVNEIGMRPMITQFQQEFIWPIASRWFHYIPLLLFYALISVTCFLFISVSIPERLVVCCVSTGLTNPKSSIFLCGSNWHPHSELVWNLST